MMPDAAARLLAAERARITSKIDQRFGSWMQFQTDYPENAHDVDMVLAELDWLREIVNNAQNPTGRQAGHPGFNE